LNSLNYLFAEVSDLLAAWDFVAAVVVAAVGCFLACFDFGEAFVAAVAYFPAVCLADLRTDCLLPVAYCRLALVFASALFVAVDFFSYRPYLMLSSLFGQPGRRTQALFLLALMSPLLRVPVHQEKFPAG